jgi:hypothetical protein
MATWRPYLKSARPKFDVYVEGAQGHVLTKLGPKINTHTLVLLIKIYSTHISAQKHANTLSICLIEFTYRFFRNYCAGGTLQETGVRALWAYCPKVSSHQVSLK